ncbi:hypothetical protein QL285_017582 [Trifolium repens]|nr:hypothetical protein QL285_017582 [Trifolium repens]
MMMMGSFASKSLLLAFGYALPGYDCFKAMENNTNSQIDPLIFWCQYWIVVAFITVVQGFGDTFISWVPFYSEAKLGFFVYLWYTKTKDNVGLYNSFIRPYMVKHEKETNDSLLELNVKAMDFVGFAWNKALIYGQKLFTTILLNNVVITSHRETLQPHAHHVHMDNQNCNS